MYPFDWGAAKYSFVSFVCIVCSCVSKMFAVALPWSFPTILIGLLRAATKHINSHYSNKIFYLIALGRPVAAETSYTHKI